MTIPTSTDLFLVNRNDISYYVTQANLMAQIKDDDLMLVNRADASYKITGLDAKQSFVDPLTLTVTITPNPPIVGQVATAVAVPSGGKVPTDGWGYTYQWKTSASADGSSPTTIAGATASTYTPVQANYDLYLGCTVSTTDALGTSVTTTNFVGPVDILEIAPAINTVTLTDLESNGNRYTSSVFPYTLDMSQAGEPAPTYAVKAKLTGATFDFNVESDTITAVTSTAGTQTYKTDTIANVVSTYVDLTGNTANSTVGDATGTTYGDPVNNVFGQTGSNPNSQSGWWGCYQTSGDTNTTAYIETRYTLNTAYTGSRTIQIFCKGTTRGTYQNIIYNGKGIGNNGPSDNAWINLPQGFTYFGVLSYNIAGNNDTCTGIGGIRYADTQELITDPASAGLVGTTLTFPTDNNFDKFEVGDVVQIGDWNQSQEWSSSLTGVGLTNPSNAFNGQTDQYADSSGGWTLDLSSYTFGSGTHTVSVKTGGATSITVNGTALTDPGGSGAKIWTGSVAGELTTIFSSTTGASLYYVEIDNKLLVDTSVSNPDAASITAIDAAGPTITTDGGSWLGANGSGVTGDARYMPDQEWSNLLTSTTGFNPTRPAANAFDGSVGAGSTRAEPANSVGLMEITLSGLTPNDVVEVYTFEYNGGGGGNDPSDNVYVEINGTKFISPPNPGANEIRTGSVDGNGNVNIKLNSTAGNYTPGWNYALLQGIKIAGRFLINSSIPGAPGAATVDKNIAYAGQLTVASDSKLAQITGGVYMTDGTFKTDGSGEYAPADYTLQTSTIASVGSPVITGDGTGGTQGSNDASWASVFNGAGTGSVTCTPVSGRSSITTCSFDPPISVGSSCILKWGASRFSNGDVRVNGINIVTGFVSNDTNLAEEQDITSLFPGGITSLSVTNNAGDNSTTISWLKVDGSYVYYPASYFTTGTPLTYDAPNPDLQYFEVGDVVQTSTSYVADYNGMTVMGGDPESSAPTINVWDGNEDTSGAVLKAGKNGNNGAITFSPYISLTSGQTLTIKYILSGGSGTNSNITVNTSDGIILNDSAQNGDQVFSYTTPAGGNTLQSITYSGQGTESGQSGFLYIYYISIDGQQLTQTGYETDITVNGIDVASNTMTVNGGLWEGSDGTGAGTWNQSQVWSATGSYYTTIDGVSSDSGRDASDKALLFNGDPDTTMANFVTVNSTSYYGAYYQFATPIPNSEITKLEVRVGWGNPGDGSSYRGMINNTSNAGLIDYGSGLQAEWRDITSQLGSDDLSIIGTAVQSPGGARGFQLAFAIKINGKLLVDTGISGAPVGATSVSYGPITGTGTIVDKTTSSPWKVSLNPVTGRWIGPNKAGTNFEFAPVIPVVDTATTVYCKMQVIDDKAEVMGIQTTDPGFLNVTKQNYDIQFPALFTDGDAPDTALPPGTELTATVKAENSKGDSVRESNTVMPFDLNPAASAGPITATEGGWNQSQVWSSGADGIQPSFPPTLAFDGSLSSAAYSENPGMITVTLPGGSITNVTSLRVYTIVANWSSSAANVFQINGVDQISQLNTTKQWYDITGVTTLTSIAYGATASEGSLGLFAVEVNGKLLVDTGVNTVNDTTQLLTTGNAENLNTFVADDALKMVDDTGAVASYIPVTNTITSVAIETTAATTTGFETNPVVALYNGSGGGGSTQSNQNGLTTVSLNLTNSLVELTSDSITFGAANGSSSSYRNFTVVFSFSDSSSITDSSKQLPPGDQLTYVLNGAVGKTLTGISWSSSNLANEVISISGLTINGSYFNVADYSDTVLTFTGTAAADNKDLKFFNAGDLLGPETGFKPVLYTGTGATQSIDCGFSPDLVWLKVRDAGSSHRLFDTVRGATKHIASDTTDAENTAVASLIDFTSNGFTLGANNNGQTNVNLLGNDYVAWCWDASDTTVTNTDGTIDSQVRSNGNFSVIKYTGNGVNGSTVGHGLTDKPSLMFVKSLDSTYNWLVYHKDISPNILYLNDSSGKVESQEQFNQTEPTSSVFTVGISPGTNSTSNYIAYAWAETPGVSSFGEYTGNGSTTGPVIDCGFEPAFIMVKKSSGGDNWYIVDTARDPSNPMTQKLCPNLSAQENDSGQIGTASANNIQTTANGFQLITTSAATNGSGDLFIYAAFATSGGEGTVVSTDLTANKMTVDGGDYALWNQSQVWSTTTTPSVTQTQFPYSNAFDGVITGDAGTNGFAGWVAGNGDITITFPAGVSVSSTIDVYSGDGLGGSTAATVVVGGVSQTSSALSGFVSEKSFTATGNLETVTVTQAGGGVRLYGIAIDGKLLVDTGVLGAPPTVATGPKKSGTGTFVSTNGTDSMTITNSNLDWISNDNRLSQDFYVQPLVTRLNKDNPAHVALQQAIVTAFSTVKTNSSPALTGDLYRLLAGETLTAAEIATLTDRLTAATHGDRPFHLDGYYPLYYTAVGANAASPTSSSHTHVLGGNTYYMPDGVTIYHGTYVPTVEAYTVLPHISTNPTTTATTTTTNTSSSSSSSSGGGSPGGGGGGY